MFEQLLNGIFHKKGLSDERAKQEHLKSLREPARKLWKSYRPERHQPVTVDYSQKKTQEAYLLRYFPCYTLLVHKVLKDLRDSGHSLPEVELMESCFFGCGPGPEFIGLISYKVDKFKKT